VALKRTGCDVWQLKCQASDATASVQSDSKQTAKAAEQQLLLVFF